jgi:hypothetical protein
LKRGTRFEKSLGLYGSFREEMTWAESGGGARVPGTPVWAASRHMGGTAPLLPHCPASEIYRRSAALKIERQGSTSSAPNPCTHATPSKGINNPEIGRGGDRWEQTISGLRCFKRWTEGSWHQTERDCHRQAGQHRDERTRGLTHTENPPGPRRASREDVPVAPPSVRGADDAWRQGSKDRLRPVWGPQRQDPTSNEPLSLGGFWLWTKDAPPPCKKKKKSFRPLSLLSAHLT